MENSRKRQKAGDQKNESWYKEEEVRVRRRRRRNVEQSFRRSCSAASALLQVPWAGYQDGFLSDCRRNQKEERERAEIRAHWQRKRELWPQEGPEVQSFQNRNTHRDSADTCAGTAWTDPLSVHCTTATGQKMALYKQRSAHWCFVEFEKKEKRPETFTDRRFYFRSFQGNVVGALNDRRAAVRIFRGYRKKLAKTNKTKTTVQKPKEIFFFQEDI